MPVREPLLLGVAYDVVCNIGSADTRSISSGDTAVFPRQLLPDGTLPLRAVLHVEGSRHVSTREFRLHAAGDTMWMRLPLPVLPSEGTIRAELAIYFEAVVIHVQELSIPVGGGSTRGGPASHLLYRLSGSLTKFGKLQNRSVSIVSTRGVATSHVLVNGIGFAPNSFMISDNAADAAVRDARTQLYDIHFHGRGGKDINNYRNKDAGGVRRHGKPHDEFASDLAALAYQGRRAYLSLFELQEGHIAATLPQLLRSEAMGRHRAPIIQAIDLGTRQAPVPWALLYDLPLGSDLAAYEVCPALAEYGPGGNTEGKPPPICPWENLHRSADGRWKANQLCPWGFWGLSTIIETPPHVPDRDLESVVTATPLRVALLVAVDPDLDVDLSDEHIESLERDITPAFLNSPPISDANELGAALSDPKMDVVYLYCHAGYGHSTATTRLEPFLSLGSTRLSPIDIDNWAETNWPDPHWPDRHPLVVLNGCHTTEATTGTLANFVNEFTAKAGASGVLGTEITLEQGIAGWAMQLFLSKIVQGETVGAALRETRWDMLRRGNLMGLAYTPFCLAVLSVRRDSREVSGPWTSSQSEYSASDF
ncbi:CHAT domain-containing protein [Streptomyces sp. NPDC048251]|uniref:CHAT domain-containing protein n=1 Tax=Streptomyces sp. NPDC048251 TaxID=3154501 RepID=UPI00341D1490